MAIDLHSAVLYPRVFGFRWNNADGDSATLTYSLPGIFLRSTYPLRARGGVVIFPDSDSTIKQGSQGERDALGSIAGSLSTFANVTLTENIVSSRINNGVRLG